MGTSYRSYMKNNVPKKNVIDGDTQELITEHGIKNYVDSSSGGGTSHTHSELVGDNGVLITTYSGAKVEFKDHTYNTTILDMDQSVIHLNKPVYFREGGAVMKLDDDVNLTANRGDYLTTQEAVKSYVDNNAGVSEDESVKWEKQQYFDNNTLTASGTTVAWSLETHQFTALTLAGNYTLSNPTDVPASGIGTYVLIVKQDATGGRTLSFSSKYKFSDGNAPTLSSAANAVDVLTFVYESSSGNMYGSAKLNLQ